MVDLPDTSDIGMMYRQMLQQRGVPLTASNMRDLVMESRRNPDLIAGLTPQQADPTAGATPPPNIAGASAQNSGQAPPMPTPPPMAPPPMQPSPSAVNMRGPEAGMPVSPAQVAQMVQRGVPYGLPGQTAPMGPQNADLSPATPPPGAAPTPAQSQPPPESQPITPGDIIAGLGGLGAGGAALYATRGGANTAQPAGRPLPMPSSAGEQIAPGSAQNQRPVGPTTKGPPPPTGAPPEPIRTVDHLRLLLAHRLNLFVLLRELDRVVHHHLCLLLQTLHAVSCMVMTHTVLVAHVLLDPRKVCHK
jgi:hypothetical protein